jgi:hypothetical protein
LRLGWHGERGVGWCMLWNGWARLEGVGLMLCMLCVGVCVWWL